MTKKDKVEKVMHEWKTGTLTSHGKKVTDYDQAVAIALSEAGLSKYARGGWVLYDEDDEKLIKVYETESEARKNLYEYEGNANIVEKSSWDNNQYAEGGGVGLDDFDALDLPISYKLINNKGEVIFKTNSFNKASDTRTIKGLEGEGKLKIIATDKSGNQRIIADGIDEDGKKYEKGGNMNEYSKGGNVIERRYVNKDEDYEVRYAKDKPSRMGYKDERMFEGGGSITDRKTELIENWIKPFSWGKVDENSNVVKVMAKKYDLGVVTVAGLFNEHSKKRGDRMDTFAVGGGIDGWKGKSFDKYFNTKEAESMINTLSRDNEITGFDEATMNDNGARVTVINAYTDRTTSQNPWNLLMGNGEKGRFFIIPLKPMQKMPKQVSDKFAVGGEIGNTVSFKGDYGTPRSGVVKEKRGSSYIVSTDDGDRLVDSYEVIGFSETPIAKKKRFGFFAEGGEISDLGFAYLGDLWFAVQQRDTDDYEKLAKYLDEEGISHRIQNEVSADASELRGRKSLSISEVHDRIKKILAKKYAGGGEIENKIEKLKKVVSSKMLPESVKAKAQAEIDKLEKELHESKETKAEEKEEHKAGGSEYKSKLEKDLEKELNRLQRDLNSFRLQIYTEGDDSEKEKARQRERTSKIIRMNEVLALLNEIEIGKENKMTSESEGERKAGMYKEEDYVEAKTKALEKSLKDKTISETQRKRDEKELALFKGAEAKPELKKITQEEWNTKKKHDYASIKDGQKYILTNINGATILVPVEIIKPEAKKPTTRKAPVRKAPVKKAVAKKEIETPSKEIVDYFKSHGKKETYLYNNRIGFNKGMQSKEQYNVNHEWISKQDEAKPKADHKKLVAKLKAKKGGKEYDNRASLVPFTETRRKRSESSDKKRSALPPGKRVSENGVTYYESRLNRTDLSKKDKFEKGGEVKGSDWGLNLNW
jgi:hypothetical protein